MIAHLFSNTRTSENLVLFTRYLAGAMRTRTPLPEILAAYQLEYPGMLFNKTVADIQHHVEQGEKLSEVLGRHEMVFPAFYRRMVALGERSQSLAPMMTQTADRMESVLKVYERMKELLIYPLIVLVLLITMFGFMTSRVWPEMAGIYNTLGAELPSVTIKAFTPFGVFFWMILVFIFLIVMLLGSRLWLFLRSSSASRFLLNLPFLGPVLRNAEIARLSSYLALMLEHRVPLANALALLIDASDSRYVREAVADLHQKFESGRPLSELIAEQPLFPPGIAVMIAHAEDQGGLTQTMHELARFYQDRAHAGIHQLYEVIAPLSIAIVGILLAVGVIGIYMPLFNIPDLIK